MNSTSKKKQKRFIKRKAKEVITTTVTQAKKDATANKTDKTNIESTVSELTEKAFVVNTSITIAAKEGKKVKFDQQQLIGSFLLLLDALRIKRRKLAIDISWWYQNFIHPALYQNWMYHYLN